MRRVTLHALLIAAIATVGFHTRVQAQTTDHLKCYRVKDPLKLSGVVNLDSLQFGLEAGCKISRAKLFCVPVTKTVISAIDKRTKPPTSITPLPISGPDPGARVCYQITCPKPFPPDTEVSDQFGTRILTTLKPVIVCAPAITGALPTPSGTPSPSAPSPSSSPSASPTPAATQTNVPTTTPTPTGCFPPGQACTSSAQCCSGLCNVSLCA